MRVFNILQVVLLGNKLGVADLAYTKTMADNCNSELMRGNVILEVLRTDVVIWADLPQLDSLPTVLGPQQATVRQHLRMSGIHLNFDGHVVSWK